MLQASAQSTVKRVAQTSRRNLAANAAPALLHDQIPSWQRKSHLTKYPQRRMPYDGATAAAYVAYAWSDQAFIYPITPATPLGDAVANWAAAGRKNLFGEICEVTQMQSEAGAAGALHGVVDVGSLCTTFTASQGLLLMIPNMYILAGALNPCVIHVTARAVTKHALCIFGDHTDVMAARQTGMSQLSAANVQESMDMALVSHVSTLKTSVPVLHFFDGFRTSHEISKPEIIPYQAMHQLMPKHEVNVFRKRGLNPNNPHTRQLGQFGDTFFQNGEAGNKYYDNTPRITQEVMRDIGHVTGRYYKLFDYVGHPQAEHVAVVMGSGGNVVEEFVNYAAKRGEKVGVIKCRLFRPWDGEAFMESMPRSTKTITVLDRTKESGNREPLFMDVATTFQEYGAANIHLYGGIYGLGSREFTPGMVQTVYDNAASSNPKNNFTVGIEDDVTFRSLPQGPEPDTCPDGTRQVLFFGMGSDGTVSANKNVIKLIGEQTEQHVQAYFAYDSKKAGGLTVSHLRFGPERIESSYGIMNADYIGVSQDTWVGKYPDALFERLRPNGTVVLNLPFKNAEELESALPAAQKRRLADQDAHLYTVDANKVARSNGLGRHTNNILSGVFLKLTNIIEAEKALQLLRDSLRKAYATKGEDIVNRNLKALDEGLNTLTKIEIPRDAWRVAQDAPAIVDPEKPIFCRDIMDPMNAMQGDKLPVSAFDPRGHYPMATTKWEKRGIAYTVPIVDMNKCTQCVKCAAICPHAAIRPFLISQVEADAAPEHFDFRKAKGGSELAGLNFRIQVAPEDCTGCEACSWACGDGALTMTPLPDVLEVERQNWSFATTLEERGHRVDKNSFKGSQFQTPMLEFSGACEGCGETPYAKLITQLFGDRMVIANSSGCSSVWTGTAAFNPLSVDKHGRGPAWGRSLFEDAAEYGFGMARAVKQKRDQLAGKMEEALFDEDLKLPVALRESFEEWLEKKEIPSVASELSLSIPKLLGQHGALVAAHPVIGDIANTTDALPKISNWVWGGDGWAYDIGFGGLDHVLAGGTDLNVMVYDTEGYSNTGGQISKATNLGAVQKFAPEGYRRAKKDLGAIAMAYEDVYVASISMGANYGQTVKALVEADAYPGTSLLLAYSPCIEHKILFPRGLSRLAEEMKKAVDSGYWPLYRYDPLKAAAGDNPFQLDNKRLSISMTDFTGLENRFRTLYRTHPEVAESLEVELQDWATRRHETMKWREARGQESKVGSKDLLILVGTDTGTTMEVASRLAENCRSRDFNVSLRELDEIADMDDLANAGNIMVLCSTAGEGDMPSTATSFWEFLSEPMHDGTRPLEGVNISVFGLGDRSYRHFNKAAIDIADRLEELGASKLQDTGMGDDQDDDKYETALEEWVPEFWKVHDAPEAPDEHLIQEPAFALTPMPKNSWSKRLIVPPSTIPLTLENNTRITPQDYDRCIFHLVFDLKDTDYSYALGDALSVYPHNMEDQVNSFLDWYKIDPESMVKVSPTRQVDARRAASYRHPMTVQQIFQEVLDVFGRPNKHFYKTLAKFATDEAERNTLNKLVEDTEEGKAAYAKMVANTETFASVLQMFPSAHPPLEHLLTMIPCVKPRLYSIASAQRNANDKCELMIVLLDWNTPSGELRIGTSTSYIRSLCLDGLPEGSSHSVACGVTNGTFNFPEDVTTPMVMTGLGTGLAPFRAFIQEWAWHNAQGTETGPMWLFYGCRHEAKDYCFGEELKQYHKDGVLTQLRPAFSRDQKEKIYVQNRMQEASNELYTDLVEKGGYFYLCGQAGQLEIDVESAIKGAISVGGKSDGEAKDFVEEMHNTGRYNLELY